MPGHTASEPSPSVRNDRPVFVIAPPFAGGGLMLQLLSRVPEFSLPAETGARFIESFEPLHPQTNGWQSSRLDAGSGDEACRDLLRAAWREQMRDEHGRRRQGPVRLLDEPMHGCLRLPFLKSLFPDAQFVVLHRSPEACIAYLIQAWQSGRQRSYPQLPDWAGPPWVFSLVPGWRALQDAELPRIASAQWQALNEQLLQDIETIPAQDLCALHFDALLQAPQAAVNEVCDFAGVSSIGLPASQISGLGERMRGEAALLIAQIAAAHPGWTSVQQNLQNSDSTLSRLERSLSARLRAAESWPQEQPDQLAPEQVSAPPPLRSIHTASFVEILDRLKSSLLVSTYQAGRLVCLRARGKALDTHFSAFLKPMGLDVQQGQLALGSGASLLRFANMPSLAKRLEATEHQADTVFLPRNHHLTGDIDIHEMAFDQAGQLWFVNTRFSCLCTSDGVSSFVPRWWPHWISALAPEDRCHLNGLGMRDGKPRYVTALAQTDTPGGWRKDKARSGVLMDLANQNIIAAGLCMPHSPRWHQDRLWVLESGKGSLASVDPQTGKIETVVSLPGFTRGLDFIGPVAFVGLSQIRETASFGELPISSSDQERYCGVWAIHIETGEVLAYLRFEEAVQEIFALKALVGARQPVVLENDSTLLHNSYALPEEAMKHVQV